MKLQKLKPRVSVFSSSRQLATLETLHEDKRLRGRALQARNQRLRQLNGLCVECSKLGEDEALKLGYTITVDEWDHIKPLWAGGVDNESNIQGLCFRHHREKSEREAAQRQAGGFCIA